MMLSNAVSNTNANLSASVKKRNRDPLGITANQQKYMKQTHTQYILTKTALLDDPEKIKRASEKGTRIINAYWKGYDNEKLKLRQKGRAKLNVPLQNKPLCFKGKKRHTESPSPPFSGQCST
jgi:hypothetical protein